MTRVRRRRGSFHDTSSTAKYQEFWYHMADDPQEIHYEWKRRTDGPPWEVLDWQGKWHTFETEQDGIDFIERDKRMLANASRAAREDVSEQITKAFQDGSGVESTHGEQATQLCREGEAGGTSAGSQGNRRSRRRNGRTANGKKASRGRR
jgi:hypothetical protein